MKTQRKDRKKPRKLKCKCCQGDFNRNISDNKFKRGEIPKFCSKKCTGKYQGLKNKGENNGMYGEKSWCNGLTKEDDIRLQSISLKKSGENHHYYGKELSNEHKQKISKSLNENPDFKKWNSLSILERFKIKYPENYNEKYNEYLNKFKGMFSKKWFINKYGELEGNKLYDERCNNISKNSQFREYNKENKNNYSSVSQEIFWKIYENIKDRYENIYFAELNNEYSCETGLYNYDFVIKDIKFVIEFNGCKFHPRKNDINWISPYGITYKEQIEKDIDKLNQASKNGYNLYYIWEDENYEDKINEILKLI